MNGFRGTNEVRHPWFVRPAGTDDVMRIDPLPDTCKVTAPVVYWCPDCGLAGTHADTCGMFPGEPVVAGNRQPPP